MPTKIVDPLFQYVNSGYRLEKIGLPESMEHPDFIGMLYQTQQGSK